MDLGSTPKERSSGVKKQFKISLEISGVPYQVFPETNLKGTWLVKGNREAIYRIQRGRCNCPATVRCKHLKVLTKLLELLTETLDPKGNENV